MRRLALIALVLVAAGVTAVVALGAEPRGWDGTNPFNCEIQQAGFEATGPDPGADPYCVEFDKRRQNATQLGIVEFVSKEPARVAAAGTKCFYFQADHWRSAVVQDDGTTALYEWDGRYFFDKAKGEGGAYVTNFTVNGRTEDPGKVPGMPPEYAQHMGPGTGGVIAKDGGEADPACAERARNEAVYAAPAASGQQATTGACRPPAVTDRRLGPVRLGDAEARVREKLGRPAEVRRGFLRFCDDGGYLVGQRSDRSGDLGTDDAEPTVMILVRKGRFRLAPGTPARSVRGLKRAGRVAGARVSVRGATVYGTRAGKVRWVAVFDRRAIRSRAALRGMLRRALVG